MEQKWMMILPILLPVLAGALIPFIKCIKERKVRRVYVTAVLGINVVLAILLIRQPDMRWEVLELVSGVPILLKMDDLSRFFIGLASIMWLFSGVFAQEYMQHEKNEERYFAYYLMVSGILVGLGLAGNLVTFYLFYEAMTLLTLPMVLHTQTKEAIRAGMKYLFYSIFGASAGLGGIFVLNYYLPSIEFTTGGVLQGVLTGGSLSAVLIAIFVMIIGFGSKAGMFPLHGWLPTAHPEAPAPASAVLSGIITKAGLLAIVRIVFYIVGADVLRGTWVQYAWMILALITIFMGSMMAYKEQVFKKRLAYSTVSQVSYGLFGLATLTQAGVVGALLQVVFHSIVKDILFLCAGAVIYKTHHTKVKELVGIGQQMPVVMICYTIAAITLVGLPPTCAFVSKEFLAHGALETGIMGLNYIGPVVLLISALLTAGYLLPISIKAFMPVVAACNDAKAEAETEYTFDLIAAGGKKEPSLWMLIPLVALVIPAIWLGMFPDHLLEFVETLAHAWL